VWHTCQYGGGARSAHGQGHDGGERRFAVRDDVVGAHGGVVRRLTVRVGASGEIVDRKEMNDGRPVCFEG